MLETHAAHKLARRSVWRNRQDSARESASVPAADQTGLLPQRPPTASWDRGENMRWWGHSSTILPAGMKDPHRAPSADFRVQPPVQDVEHVVAELEEVAFADLVEHATAPQHLHRLGLEVEQVQRATHGAAAPGFLA